MAGMQYPASSMDSGWLDILSRLPSDLDLNQLARDNKAIQRLRGITDAADLLRLALARGPVARRSSRPPPGQSWSRFHRLSRWNTR
jgi:hypothetical protein